MKGGSRWLEWMLYGLTVVALSVFFVATDAFEWMYQTTRQYETLELDEWALICLAILIVAAIAAIVRSIRLEREIARRKLLEQQLAEEFRTKREFLGVLGHEMRTPLNGIISMLNLAKSETDPAQTTALVDTGLQAAMTMNRLLDDLLSFARLEQITTMVESASFSVQYLLKEVADSFGWLAAEKGVRLNVSVASGTSLSVIGYPVAVRQILVNLVSNGVKFTKRGEVGVQAAIAAGENGGSLLKLTVSDTGPGISPDHQAKIFDAFYQVEGHATRRASGVGLGLNIVVRLVKILDGTVQVSSVPGEGATFEVCIPVQLP